MMIYRLKTDYVLLFTFILMQALINSDWMYSPVGWFDPWYYLGYAHNYTDASFLNNYYKISRLPWILIEFIVRNTFSHNVSAWILQISLLLIAASSIYKLLCNNFDEKAAFSGATLFLAFTFTHSSGGADYHNTLAGPAFAITWYLTDVFSRNSSNLTGLFLGIMLAMMIHSNIVFINLCPLLIFYYLSLRHFNKIEQILFLNLFMVLVGIFSATAFLGCINWMIGRDFLFFIPQFQISIDFISDASLQKSWWHPWNTYWFLDSDRTYLPLLITGYFFSLLITSYILISKKYKIHYSLALFSSFNFIAGSIWIFWQVRGQTALDWSYFAYPLVYPLCAFYGALISILPKNRRYTQKNRFSFLTKITMIFIFIMPYLQNTIKISHLGIINITLILALAQTIVFLGNFYFKKHIFYCGLFIFSISLAICTPNFLSGKSNYNISWCEKGKNASQLIDKIHLHLKARGLPLNRTYIWYDQESFVSIENKKCPFEDNKIKLSSIGASLNHTGMKGVQEAWETNKAIDLNLEKIGLITEHKSQLISLGTDDKELDILINRLKQFEVEIFKSEKFIIRSESLALPIEIFDLNPKAELDR